jgi:GNAT superfamily N-acetyltransferase
MSDAELIRHVYETAERYLALNCETFEADGATFIRDRNLPDRYDANHVYDVRAETPEQIEALLSRVDGEYDGYRHRAYDLGPLTPPQFVARLSLDGAYRWRDSLQMVLEGDLKASPRPADIRLVEDEAQWRAIFALETMWWETDPPDARAPLDQTLAYFRGRSPQVRWWLAYVDGVPRAFLNSWEGENGVGQVEDLFTHPEYRHQGLATALLAHCVTDARAHGAGPVIIGCEPNDTPKHMYAAMGWRPLYVVRHVVKRVGKTR